MIIEQVLFYTIFFGFFIVFIYVHVAYPFWVHMPITHIYDMHHRVSDPHIILHHPTKNKYVDLFHCKTKAYDDLCDSDINICLSLLASSYIPADSILFAIEPQHFAAFFAGANTLISVYYSENNIEGHICTIPVNLYYSGFAKQIHNCVYHVARGYNKDVKEKLLGTHVYKLGNQPLLYKKHVGECAGVKPFARFTTTLMYMGLLQRTQSLLQPMQIYRANWSYLYDIMDNVRAVFPCVIALDPGIIKTRVDNELMMIFVIKVKTAIVAAYFFEDALQLHETVGDYGGKTLRLCGSLKNGLSNDAFIEGFNNCVYMIQKRNKDYVMCMMDNTGHNEILMNAGNVLKKTEGMYVLMNHSIQKTCDYGLAFVLV